MPGSEIMVIFTSSDCAPETGAGGWGSLLRYTCKGKTSEKELSGCEESTTDNRMGLVAVVEALAALNRPMTVDLHTVSLYVRRGINEWLPKYKGTDWKKADGTDLPNADLWRRLETLVGKQTVRFHWTKEKNRNSEYERVGELAKNAAGKATSVMAEQGVSDGKVGS